MKKYLPSCVPGIPVKRYNPCVSPTQQPISHIVASYKIVKDDLVFDTFEPNVEDYPEYAYLIQRFIDKELSDEIQKRKRAEGTSRDQTL